MILILVSDWFTVRAQDHHDTLKGRRIYAQLVITFRHGKEEEEMMGLSFKKELVLDRWVGLRSQSRIQIDLSSLILIHLVICYQGADLPA